MVTAPLALDKNALAALCREYDLTLVLLFGSRAAGETHADSDTDIGVVRRRGPMPTSRLLERSLAW